MTFKRNLYCLRNGLLSMSLCWLKAKLKFVQNHESAAKNGFSFLLIFSSFSIIFQTSYTVKGGLKHKDKFEK